MHKHYGQTEVPCMVFPHRHNKNIVYLNKLLLFSMKINIIQCDRECDEVKVKVSIHIYIYTYVNEVLGILMKYMYLSYL